MKRLYGQMAIEAKEERIASPSLDTARVAIREAYQADVAAAVAHMLKLYPTREDAGDFDEWTDDLQRLAVDHPRFRSEAAAAEICFATNDKGRAIDSLDGFETLWDYAYRIFEHEVEAGCKAAWAAQERGRS